jgi:hypothetical protein
MSGPEGGSLGVMKLEPIDASKGVCDDAREGRKSAAKDTSPQSLSARGFSAIMHREATIRASLRPPGKGDKGALLGGLYLAPNMRRALAALLRGDPVTAQERAALTHAVSLLPADEPEAASSPVSRETTLNERLWAGLVDAANSNDALTKPARGLVVPLLPQQAPGKDRRDNPVLRGLGLERAICEENYAASPGPAFVPAREPCSDKSDESEYQHQDDE